MDQGTKKYDLEDRTYEFALAVHYTAKNFPGR